MLLPCDTHFHVLNLFDMPTARAYVFRMNLKINSDYLCNRLVFVMVTECVYCAVETDAEKYVQINFILPIPLYNIFPHYLINGTIKKKYWTYNVCFEFLYNFCPKHFSL
jgi:hypothetical protein